MTFITGVERRRRGPEPSRRKSSRPDEITLGEKHYEASMVPVVDA
jgi:hypothetical protein